LEKLIVDEKGRARKNTEQKRRYPKMKQNLLETFFFDSKKMGWLNAGNRSEGEETWVHEVLMVSHTRIKQIQTKERTDLCKLNQALN